MANEIGTPITGTLPTVGVTPDIVWANMLNLVVQALIDAVEAGVRSSIGLQVDADLSLDGYRLTNAAAVKLDGTVEVEGLAVYSDGTDLFYNDVNGTSIQITASGTLNAAAVGGIVGDYGGSNPAKVTYNDSNATYVFTQDPGISAAIDAGEYKLRRTGAAGANAVTLKSPASLAASYDVTFLTALPASTGVLTITSAGQLASSRALSIDSVALTGNITGGVATFTTVAGTFVTASLGTFGGSTFIDAGITTGAITSGAITSGAISSSSTVTAVATISGGALTTAQGVVHRASVLTVLPTCEMYPRITSTGGPTAAGNITFDGSIWTCGASAVSVSMTGPIKVVVGERLTACSARVQPAGAGTTTLKLWEYSTVTGAQTQRGTTQSSSGTALQSLSISGLTLTVTSSTAYFLEVVHTTSGSTLVGANFTTDVP